MKLEHVSTDALLASNIINNAAVALTEEEQARKNLLEEVMACRVSVTDEFPPEESLLSVGGVEFFAKGDIHAIKAKQKQGKTNAISLMVATLLSGKWGPLTAVKENARVLVIDTEQKAADTQLIYNRTLQLAGLPKEDIFERFQTFCLRPFERERKLEALKSLVAEFKPDIVFVDGVVDLMGNFNEVDDSKEIIEELIRMSTKEISGIDVAIVCVLHTNKATDDHNMRGHAGTMLAQKSCIVLEVMKKDGIFTISNSDSRHKEVPEWSYRFDENDNIVDASTERKQMLEEALEKRREDARERAANMREMRINTLIQTVRSEKGGINRTNLNKKLCTALKLGRSTIDSLIKDCFNENIIALNDSKNVIVVTDIDAVQEAIAFQ